MNAPLPCATMQAESKHNTDRRKTMKKRIGILVLAIAVTLALLCVSAAGEDELKQSFGEMAEGQKVNAVLKGDNRCSFFYSVIYAQSAVPSGLMANNMRQSLYLSQSDESSDQKNPDAGLIEFVSGDEALRDSLCFEISKWTEGEVELCTRLAGKEPGEAVFRLRLKAGSLYYEEEFTLRLVSWEEYPLFEFRNTDMNAVAQMGSGDVLTDSFGNVSEDGRSRQNNTNLYTEDQLASLLLRDHSKEVMAAVLTEEQLSRANALMESRDGGIYDLWPEEQGGDNFLYPQENLWRGWIFETLGEGYQFRAYGTYTFELYLSLTNIHFKNTVAFLVMPYQISGPSSLMPGGAGVFSVEDKQAEAGRTFTLNAEGEGIAFDAGTGAMTVAEDTPEGTVYTVTAVPSDGGPAVTLQGKVSSGLIAGGEYTQQYLMEGFSVPVPSDEKYSTRENRQNDSIQYSVWTPDESAPDYIYIDYTVFTPLEVFAEDAGTAESLYTRYPDYQEYQEEMIMLDGHPALAQVYRVADQDGDYSFGMLKYARNNRIIRIRVYSIPQNGTDWEDLPKVTLADMRTLAGMITYDPAQASMTVADGAISLSAKEGTDVLTGGKKLTLVAAFASPDKVNKKAKNDTVEWSVTDPETGAAPEGVSIDAKGALSAPKDVAEVLKVEVKATSPVFRTSATFPVTVIPAMKKLAVEPAEIFFYTGTESTATVKAVPDPETVPPIDITWTAVKAGIIEITPDESNGTAVIRPLAAGKTAVNVKEPGGKNAKLNVSVVAPVEDLELTVSGKTAPGGTVTVKETLLPKEAGNKNVEWSLDVGEDIATIAKGKVKIAKNAPAGTVVTVTCTATGAPEPVVRTVQIEVTEK